MNWKHRAGALLLALGMVLSLAPAAAAAANPQLSVSRTNLNMKTGETERITATLVGAEPAPSSVEMRFQSSNPSVAKPQSETAAGTAADMDIVAVGEGNAVITATAAYDGKEVREYITVTVARADTSSGNNELTLTITGDNETEAGSPVALRLELSNRAEVIDRVNWNPSGVITKTSISGHTATAEFLYNTTGIQEVTATVYTESGKNVTSSIRIRVNPAEEPPVVEVPAQGIAMNQVSPVYISRNTGTTLTAVTTPSNATDPVTWEIASGEGVIRLVPDEKNDRRCVIEGLTTGAATVIAKAGDYKTAPFVIEVSGLTLNPTEMELFENGEPGTLTVNRYGAAREMQLIWESQSEAIANVVNGKVYPNSTGNCKIIVSAGANYRAECDVTVKENVAGMIERSISGGTTYALSGVLSDLQSRCQEMTKDSLRLVRGFTVSPDAGVLHYNYTSPEFQGQGVGGESYYVSPSSSLERGISGITFAPKNGFSGNADISYTGESSKGNNFSGVIRINVTSTGDVTYNTASNLPVTFQAADFTAICRPRTGQEIKYLSFQQPANGKGTLYRSYSATAPYNAPLTAADKFYRTSNPPIDEVTYVPEENGSSTVRIPYLCVTTSNGSYTGTVTVHVYPASTATGQGHVNYTVAPGSRVTLRSGDFDDACRNVTGRPLDYVYFDLPSTSQGRLYLNYRSSTNTGTAVSSSTRYYRSGSPQISNITFVPASGFTGTVTVPFTAYDRNGENFKGNMVIQVSGSDSTVYYSTGTGRPVTFSGQDFNEACQRINGTSVDYLSFETPSTSRGRLYRNYRSSSSTGSSLSDSTRLYYRGTPAISDVTFVPASGYSGTVTIPFSGYDSRGDRFTGTVEIAVGSGSASDVVSYSVDSGGVVNFRASDFNEACQTITGERLNYVRFSMPASRYGVLYYQYNSGTDSGTSVTGSTSYYRSGSSRLLDDVSFLASGGTTGTVSFDYTGWNTAGRQFTGTVEITVSSPRSQVIRYATGSAPVSLRLADFRSACSTALGGSLSYIRLNSLPGSGAGQVRLDGGYAYTGTSYYADSTPSIAQLSFVPAAGYQGVASVSFTGWDTRGRSFNGTVEITVNNASASSALFTDLGGYSGEFVTAIEYLNRAGVVNGYGNGQFGPGRQVSRGEFALMICRAFNLNTGATSSFPDVPAGSVYAWAVATARDLGIVQGSNGMYHPGSPITRQAAMTMICRAMRAAGRSVPNVSVSMLRGYSDYTQVSEYAQASVASLVQMGAVRGDASMRLNPTQSITRAQMAVILYRVLTAG